MTLLSETDIGLLQCDVDRLFSDPAAKLIVDSLCYELIAQIAHTEFALRQLAAAKALAVEAGEFLKKGMADDQPNESFESAETCLEDITELDSL